MADLQFKADSERFFEKLFNDNFIYSQSFCHKSAEWKSDPTKRAAFMVTDVKPSFDLFISPNIQTIVIEMTNQKAVELYGNNWPSIYVTELDAGGKSHSCRKTH